MEDLPGWRNAAAVVLSCPGPLRRHQAALMPVGDAALPQVLLGAESQLLAFAAAARALRGKLYFAPFPEMFPDAQSLRAAWRRLGGQPDEAAGKGLVHLRFGGVRAARVLKGVRNACVVAEAGDAVPLTASHHPFASGQVVPAAVNRIFVYGPDCRRPTTVDGAVLPTSRLSLACVDADLAILPEGTEGELDLVSFGEFRSFAWAAGPVRPRGARAGLQDGRAAVLLPWNMDNPGSIVPDLLIRLASLHVAARHRRTDELGLPAILVLPFNYVGQTGIIRRLIARLRDAAAHPDELLSELFMGRVGSLGAIAQLRRLAPVAWVDGNDPEHWWTRARLNRCGIRSVLLDPEARPSPDGTVRVHADEAVWVEAETRCGMLTFPARLPSLRSLPGLLALSAQHARTETEAAAPRRAAGRRARPGRPARAAAITQPAS